VIGSGAAAAAVAVALATAGASETTVLVEAGPPAPTRVAVENCSTRSQGRFPGAYTERRNLVVGPLSMYGAGKRKVHYFRDFGSDAGGQKFQLLVRNGHRATVELSPETRQEAGLAYGPLGGGRVSLADANRVVRFRACAKGRRSGSSADGRPVTFWSGGVLAASRRCVPLEISVDDRPPRSEVIRLGVRRCET
jgi:hypothetical protein